MSKSPVFSRFKFAFHPSVSKFYVSSKTYFSRYPDENPEVKYIATGALVMNRLSNPARILLIQRATKDSMPNLWETPGGGCDDDDQSILHAVARELSEEAGLTATKIGPQVGDSYVFHTRGGKTVRKFSFLVDVETGAHGQIDITLDRNEHQNYVWATEEEIKALKANDIRLEFATTMQKQTVLQVFEVLRATDKSTK